MKKPLIGITSGVQPPDAAGVSYERYYASSAYVSSIERADGVPLVLPVSAANDIVKAHANIIDGLLLSGGVDVNPLVFGEEPQQKLREVCDARDWYELALIKEVMQQDKPVFGICRGIQVLNVACGGTLWQDIYTIRPEILKHRQESGARHGSHTIRVQSGTLMEKLFSDKTLVNSFHHQACNAIAPGFAATAWTADGIVEAIERQGAALTFGVQWHPEHMAASTQKMLELFVALVDAAKKRMEQSK